jgi:hypothetical protein
MQNQGEIRFEKRRDIELKKMNLSLWRRETQVVEADCLLPEKDGNMLIVKMDQWIVFLRTPSQVWKGREKEWRRRSRVWDVRPWFFDGPMDGKCDEEWERSSIHSEIYPFRNKSAMNVRECGENGLLGVREWRAVWHVSKGIRKPLYVKNRGRAGVADQQIEKIEAHEL